MNLDIFNPNLSVVELKYLIGKGLNVNLIQDNKSLLRFHYNSLEKVKLLVEAGIDLNLDRRVLFENMSDEVLEYLIEAGVDVNKYNYNYLPQSHVPLHYHRDSLTKVKLLVEAGADPKDILFERTLSDKVFRYLIAAGVDINISHYCLGSPLHYHRHNLSRVKLLIEAGADPKDILFERTLSDKVLEYLIKAGIDVNRKNYRRKTPLFYHNDYLEKVKLLVEAGADVNAVDDEGRTILFYELLPTPVLKYLIEAGIDVNVKDDYYGSILFKHRGSLTKVKLLVEAGADISGLILFENLPDPVFEYLVKAGANINKRYKGESLLMYYRDNPERVNLLIEAGAMY